MDEFLVPMRDPELVFGLVGSIGVDLKGVVDRLNFELDAVSYRVVYIHLTDYLRAFSKSLVLQEKPLERRYESYIDAGNKLREMTKRADFMALLAVAAIQIERSKLTGGKNIPVSKTAYVISQFKRPEEIHTLRRVYGRGFVQISAFCSKPRRLDSLTHRIAESYYREKEDAFYQGDAQKLIARDDSEEEKKYGQRVRDTFPLADVVLNADSPHELRKTCNRFIRAFFSDNFVTPSIDEYGIFLSKAVSLRSSDLARQVGAVAMTPSGEVITMGCNEVPKAGGGTYWEGLHFDHRDFQLGYDSSVRVRRQILQDVFRRLKSSGWLSDEKSKLDVTDIVSLALEQDGPDGMKDSNIMDILEFGRSVHAEMSAISDAARNGRSLKGAVLYCTTFPCHICARHIVASGFDRVVYLEPYTKSLASELYPDSIEIEGDVRTTGPKVKFEPFIGIGPERYADIFSKSRRKNDKGEAIFWDARKSEPILKRLVAAYLNIESGVLKGLFDTIASAGLEIDAAALRPVFTDGRNGEITKGSPP